MFNYTKNPEMYIIMRLLTVNHQFGKNERLMTSRASKRAGKGALRHFWHVEEGVRLSEGQFVFLTILNKQTSDKQFHILNQAQMCNEYSYKIIHCMFV